MMLGYDAVHAQLHAFLAKWRRCLQPPRGGASHPSPRPYMVSADVAGAFESVDTRVVLGLVDKLLTSPTYLLTRYSQVRCTSQETDSPW